MTSPRRLLLLVIPLALGLGSYVLPGRAQETPQGRFAFADTTLLRDTLGLTFEGLFPIADSLGMPPVDLRALSIRYRYTLPRLLKLSDSLHMVVDSVGEYMLRERYNPLATTARRRGNQFTYRSTYDITRTDSRWNNTTDFFVPFGKVLISGSSGSEFHRAQAGGRTSLDQSRTLSTRAGWTFSKNLSATASADLSSLNNGTRGSLYNSKNDDNKYSLSGTSKFQPRRGTTSEFSFSGGAENYNGSDQQRKSLNGGLTGRLRNVSGSWFTHDASGGFSGDVGDSRLPGQADYLRARSSNANLRGTLGLFSNAPIGLNLNYSLRNQRYETPTDSGVVFPVLSGSNGIDMSLRFRLDNNRYITVAPRLASSNTAAANSPQSQNTRRDRGVNVSGRYEFLGAALDGSFVRTLTTTKYPKRGGDAGGYAEERDSRSVQGSMNWQLTRKITAKLTGEVDLDRLRYSILGSFLNPPVPRDQYGQSYRADATYAFSKQFDTHLGVEVRRSLFVNIPAASTAANTETRGYRAVWDWKFALLSGLTVNQNNTLNANYTYYTFLPASADRLVLDYFTSTRIDADVTRSLRIGIKNDFRYTPTGGFAPLDPPNDNGNSYFSQSDENFQSVLSANMSYQLGSAITLSVTPIYTATDRKGFTEGIAVPQTSTRSLGMNGSANLNIPIGRKGTLTGFLGKTFNADHRINYNSGVPDSQPRVEIDFWSGSLALSWDL